MPSFISKTVPAFAIPMALVTATLFSGCATTSVSPESRAAYDTTQKSLTSKPVAIVSDGCLIRIEMGKDDILYQQSDLGSIAMMHTVKETLDEKGLSVATTVAPFVCGTVAKEDLTKLDIRPTADGKAEKNATYPLLSSGNTLDDPANQAYLDLFTTLTKDKRKAARDAEGSSVDLGLDSHTAQYLSDSLGTDTLFVSMVSGSQPSFGYSMAMGIATGVATGGTAFTMPQQGQYHSLYLLDLSEDTIKWGKRSPFEGKLMKMPVSERFAYKEMLEPLYEQN